MRNLIWIIIGVIGLLILMLMLRNESQIPNVSIVADTLDNRGGMEDGGDVPILDQGLQSHKKIPSEDFLGKTHAKCLEMVFDWPDAQLIKADAGNGGIPTLEFIVNNNHHLLEFLNDKCEVDNILNKE